MEGKCAKSPLMIMAVLILGLFLAQTQVAAKSCCVNTTGRNCYNTCRLTGASQATCANLCGCIHVTGSTCPASHPKLHFCKLGCESSMCSTISINSDVGEELVQPCINKCSELCNQGASDEEVVFTA